MPFRLLFGTTVTTVLHYRADCDNSSGRARPSSLCLALPLAVTLTFDLWSQMLINNPNTYVTKIGWNSIHRFFEIWCSKSFRSSPCCDLDLWPFDLITMFHHQAYVGQNFGEFSSNIYEGIVVIRLFGSLPAVTLNFDFCPQNPFSTSTNPNTYDLWPKFGDIP